MSDLPFDCVIVGGGPAGLTAALYLGRFLRRVLIVDKGQSRARHIPLSHNQAGFVRGVSGPALLQRMTLHALRFGAEIVRDHVQEVRVDGGRFLVRTAAGHFAARTVLLATGVVNRRPAMAAELHDTAVARGLIRYCPICDGFELKGQRIGVFGSDPHGIEEALFLRTYSDEVVLLPEQPIFARADCDRLRAAGVSVIESGVHRSFSLRRRQIVVEADGVDQEFDALYIALGSRPNIDLCRTENVTLTSGECITVDAHQMTSVPGIYAAGDVVDGLDQIAVAMGHAAVAATAIHNRLRQADGLTRGF